MQKKENGANLIRANPPLIKMVLTNEVIVPPLAETSCREMLHFDALLTASE